MLNVTGFVGRTTLDAVVIGIIAIPTLTVGLIGGVASGAAIGAISHPIIEKSGDIREWVSDNYGRKSPRSAEADKLLKSRDRE